MKSESPQTTLFGRLNEVVYGKLPNQYATKALLSDAQTALIKQQAEIERLRALLTDARHTLHDGVAPKTDCVTQALALIDAELGRE